MPQGLVGMAQNAVAQELLHDLRRKIAAIEGTPERFAVSDAVSSCATGSDRPDPFHGAGKDGAIVVRSHGKPAGFTAGSDTPPAAVNRNRARHGLLQTGVTAFDNALGGGLTRGALCEIHGPQARDAGAVSGFALALASLAHRTAGQGPLLWIGARDLIAETGSPHVPSITRLFDIPHQALLFARAEKPLDALWIAGEAAGLSALSAIIIEIRAHPQSLDLTATRRLHRRAQVAGRPVFLLRLSASPQPTAAPARLRVCAAPARPREIFGKPLPRSLGAPAFAVTIDKCRANPGRRFILEWRNDEQRFYERRPEDHLAMVPASADRQDHAPALRPVLAFRSGGRRKTG